MTLDKLLLFVSLVVVAASMVAAGVLLYVIFAH
jgi:hypothetical protein